MEESEHEVAQILLELSNLIAESEPSSRCRLKWRATGKRSAAMVGPTPSTACETDTETEKEKRHMALSPTSPFLFPHEITKRQPKIKISFKRKTKLFLNMGDELTESNRIFNEEIKKRKISYDQLKALNLKLIAAVKESESTSTRRQQPSQYMAHQQPFIMDQTAHSLGISSQYPEQDRTQNPSNGDKKKVGPFLLPDLNIPLEEDESFAIMESKALAAAQARQRRIQILRSKATNKLPKSHFCR